MTWMWNCCCEDPPPPPDPPGTGTDFPPGTGTGSHGTFTPFICQPYTIMADTYQTKLNSNLTSTGQDVNCFGPADPTINVPCEDFWGVGQFIMRYQSHYYGRWSDVKVSGCGHAGKTHNRCIIGVLSCSTSVGPSADDAGNKHCPAIDSGDQMSLHFYIWNGTSAGEFPVGYCNNTHFSNLYGLGAIYRVLRSGFNVFGSTTFHLCFENTFCLVFPNTLVVSAS